MVQHPKWVEVLSRVAMALALVLGAIGQMGSAALGAAGTQSPVRFQTISSQDLAEMLKHKDFVLVNVHIPYEGEIAATDLFVPFDQVAVNLDKLPANKDAKIVVYCRSGRMSRIAAETLVGLGYTGVEDLGGGMVAWEAAGNSLLHN